MQVWKRVLAWIIASVEGLFYWSGIAYIWAGVTGELEAQQLAVLFGSAAFGIAVIVTFVRLKGFRLYLFRTPAPRGQNDARVP